jgi:hypothetical protein
MRLHEDRDIGGKHYMKSGLQAWRFKAMSLAVLLAASGRTSFGAIITTGHFDFGGTIYVTGAGGVATPGGVCPAGTQCIFWTDPTNTALNKADISGSGLPNGNIPLAISGNLAANIFNLTNPPEVVGGAGFAPSPFMTFNNGGITTSLLINFIDPGIYSSANCFSAPISGQQCTLPGSPFNFVNNSPPSVGNPCGDLCQATATWVFEGVTSEGNKWVGNFTSQFPLGKDYQEVFSDLATTGFVSNTFSGTITLIPTPEPATMGLTGGALLLAGLCLRRKRSTGN